jgi:Mg2+/citrate symporter
MQFNAPAQNTLFVKVSVKMSPYANKPVCIRLLAHNFDTFTSNNALYFADLPIHSSTTLAVIQAKIESFRAQNNARQVSVKFQPKVLKLVTASVAQ